jgi:predicted nucleic acid-binding Zn ribbon protein
MSDRKSDAVHIGDILQRLLKTGQSDGNFDLTQIWHVWDRAVGPLIAENAHPAGFKGNILLVYANSSAWVQQLRFLKQDVIEKLNRELGKDLVSDIRFKVGTWQNDHK